ncbi:MAG: exo-alpha-sialidase [Actinomycetota bacterium]
MRPIALRAALLIALVSLLTLPRGVAADSSIQPPSNVKPCVRPVSAMNRPGCAFDIEGSIVDLDGAPVVASVSEGANALSSDRQGFFDLYSAAPGTHHLVVSYRAGCATTSDVTIADDAVISPPPNSIITVPCRQPSYESFGFSFVRNGVLNAIVRHAELHIGDIGTLRQYQAASGKLASWKDLSRTRYDERDAAGGVTPSGSVVTFYALFDVGSHTWHGIRYTRTGSDGVTSGAIDTGSNFRYHSPYGPIVALPSGRLMQTFYGFDDHHSRAFVAFSNDDGRTWSSLHAVESNPPYAITESVAIRIAGATDATSKLIMISRAEQRVGDSLRFGLVQYVSSDGGATWRSLGWIAAASSSRETIPWLTTLQNGRIALVWVDRASMTLRRSIATASAAFSGRWPSPDDLYQSALRNASRKDPGDFGYPSIASYGPSDSQKVIVFSDVDPLGCIPTRSDVDLFTLPLDSAMGAHPQRLSM